VKELKNNIQQAEKKYLSVLSNYCASVFNGTNIPSHDHSHHLRVWEYSKEILEAIYNSHQIDYELIESCLIASLFHDTGLTKTLSENHGNEGRKICIQYFEENKLPKPDKFEEILFAIENHDDKDYKQNITEPNSIFSILCNADDLDAFGKVGIVRYTEIYLLRGITLNQLPESVINNLDKRFINFKNTYQNFTKLYEKHHQKYLITRKFFQDLKDEL
jgi:HD superfamily phosphodiesterase